MSRRHREPGFTLTELAVVLAVVAMLLGGMLLPLAAQIDLRQRQDAAKALATIQDALLGFAVINGRLPCPATPSVASGSGGNCPSGGAAAAAGCEATIGSGVTQACTAAAGVLPWATLGLPETDAWGNRYTYRVTTMYARGIDPAQLQFGAGCALNPADHSSYDPALGDGPRQAAFAICTPGDISVLASAGGTALAEQLPAIVVAHGKNGAGAYTPQGTRIAPAAPGSNDYENTNDDAIFVAADGGDDMLVWLPRSLLVARMMSAGKLP